MHPANWLLLAESNLTNPLLGSRVECIAGPSLPAEYPRPWGPAGGFDKTGWEGRS